MLAPIVSLALVAMATFDSEQTLKEQSGFFISQVNGEYARVMATKPNAKHALEKACRHALTLPYRNQVREDLAKQLSIKLPEKVSFIQATISDYQQEKQDQWLTCTGKVVTADDDTNLAGLALRAAWKVSSEESKLSLRPLLRVAMNHHSSTSDAVALIAQQSPKNERLPYLDKYLIASELQLDQAKAAVAQIWFNNQRFQQTMELAQRCESIACRKLFLAAQTEYEQRTADDLSSYF
ncbi:hypothetical protein [Pseudoalteromonas 'SMAR']|uniref:hypothetical protein n=1 Tax=Pseudoalteromonas 'SMAR' TaxID=3416908 RepID=UPI003AF292CE